VPGRGDYEASLAFVPPDSAEDGIEAYTRSAKDGSIQDRVTVDVTLGAGKLSPLPSAARRCRVPLVEGTASVFEAAL
jgi:hypothetical protein